MSATAAGSISTSSQLGYAVSLMLLSWLADRVGAKRVFLASSMVSAVAAMAFALFARSYLSALLLFPLVSVSQGGTYTTVIMLLMAGYTAHSWELLGMWAWVPAFLAASFALSGSLALQSVQLGAYASSSFHVMGLFASFGMGGLSDRLGRRAVLVGCAAVATV